ncbi:MAG: hypothetical protein V1694_10275 [Candidatus Eisenbacteria bacterium]
MAKLYPPVAYMDGKMTPFIQAGLGIRALDSAEPDAGPTDTESKMLVSFKVGFDFWMTPSWTVWTAFQGDKMIVDNDKYFDDYGRDLSEFDSSIRIGFSHFFGTE